MNLSRGAAWSSRLASRLLLALGLALAAPAMAGDTAAKGGDAPTVRELSAAWWQWALSIPASVNPLGDLTGALCGVGQHGKVWFLGGTLDGSPANRSCKVPAGTAIFFPVINAECSVIEDQTLGNKAELRACAKGFMDLVTSTRARVDGRPANVVRARSALFAITLPPGDVLGIVGDPQKSQTPNPSPAVADGFWVFIEPLPKGVHSIASRGKLVFPDQSTFEQQIAYSIEVVPPRFGGSAAVPLGAIPPAVVPSPAD